MVPAFPQEAPEPGVCGSMIVTARPSSRKRIAVASPMTPPPMIAISVETREVIASDRNLENTPVA
jgi:hypothetical protein